MEDFAVIETGGKQYKVKEKDEIRVDKLSFKKGEKLEFKDLLSGGKVKAVSLGEEKGKKIIVFKYKRRKRYRRKTGHRQVYTRLLIEKID